MMNSFIVVKDISLLKWPIKKHYSSMMKYTYIGPKSAHGKVIIARIIGDN